jgi:hypothetical protein
VAPVSFQGNIVVHQGLLSEPHFLLFMVRRFDLVVVLFGAVFIFYFQECLAIPSTTQIFKLLDFNPVPWTV